MRKSMITLNRKWIRLIGIVGCTMCLASCKQASDASGMKPSYATMKVEATDKETFHFVLSNDTRTAGT